MVVYNGVEATEFRFTLKSDPIANGSEVVTEMECACGLDAAEDGLYVVHIYLINAFFGGVGPSQTHLQPHPTKVEDGLPSATRQIVSHFTAASAHLIILGWVVVSFVGANEMKRL